MDKIKEIKQNIRKEAKLISKSLSKEEKEEASKRIAELVINLPEYKASETVMLFLSMTNEPSTENILKDALKSKKKVCIPLCTDCQNYIMEARLYDEDHLSEGAYGIIEPSSDSDYVSPEQIDFVLVPCVMCDENCNRLGHGVGYYDRWMAGQNFTKACVCFEKLIYNNIPTDEYDLKMDYVITEKGIRKQN